MNESTKSLADTTLVERANSLPLSPRTSAPPPLPARALPIPSIPIPLVPGTVSPRMALLPPVPSGERVEDLQGLVDAAAQALATLHHTIDQLERRVERLSRLSKASPKPTARLPLVEQIQRATETVSDFVRGALKRPRNVALAIGLSLFLGFGSLILAVAIGYARR